jgi:ribosomal protein S12 methylthiotransferase accessory factor
VIDRRNPRLALGVGAAAGLDAVGAAIKALIEAAQVRQWLKMMRDDPARDYREDFSDVTAFEDHVRLFAPQENLKQMDFLTGSQRSVAIDQVRALPRSQPADELRRCVEALAERGYDVIAFDLTQPDVAELGFQVVRVMVPGLIDLNADHNYPRLGTGRLHRMPRLLGYADRDTSDDEFNRFPHPFP